MMIVEFFRLGSPYDLIGGRLVVDLYWQVATVIVSSKLGNLDSLLLIGFGNGRWWHKHWLLL